MAKRDDPPASEEAWKLAHRVIDMLAKEHDPMVIFQALELAVASFALKMPSPDHAVMMVNVMTEHIGARIENASYDPMMH